MSGLLASFPHGWYNEGEESLGTRGLSADGVREGSHPLALSPGCSGGNLDFQRGRFDCSGGEFGFRRNGRGALRSPTSPRGTGCERAATLSRSPVGLCWRGFGFLTGRAFRRRIWFPAKQAWGALLPYSPRGRGARGLRPSRALPGLCWRGFGFSTELVQAFRRRIWLPTKRAWGAPLPYIPSGDGVREGATLSRSPVGLFWRGFGFSRRDGFSSEEHACD